LAVVSCALAFRHFLSGLTTFLYSDTNLHSTRVFLMK
jgi:hypothetical protein